MSSRFKTPFKPFKNAIAMSRTRSTVRRQFKHVTCTDEELSQYFKDATAARAAMMELSERSWEYQFEFAVEISKQCHFIMDDDPNMNEAYNFFENWYGTYMFVLTEGLKNILILPVNDFLY
jgi:hypothetical protein